MIGVWREFRNSVWNGRAPTETPRCDGNWNSSLMCNYCGNKDQVIGSRDPHWTLLGPFLPIPSLVFSWPPSGEPLTRDPPSALRSAPAHSRPLAGRQPELLFSASASLRADEFRKLMESEARGRVVTSICYTRRERFIWNASRLLLFSLGTRPLMPCARVCCFFGFFQQFPASASSAACQREPHVKK